jgi:membrane protease YdiL (CAAX protease family)
VITSPENLPIGPILAAALVSALMGRAEFRWWWHQLRRLRTSVGWYVLAFVAPIVIVAVAVLVNVAFGAPLPTASQLAGWTGLPVLFLVFLLLVGVGEEAGWMAFAAPRLLDRYTFVAAWVLLSTIRILWHLPLMITGDLPVVLGIVGNAAFQFLLLWLFVRSGGVWFLAAIWHATLNVMGSQYFFQMVTGADNARLGVLMSLTYVVIAAVVYVADRRRLSQPAEVAERPPSRVGMPLPH